MSERPRFRPLVETEEYSAQFDALEAKYSPDLIERSLRALFWGITTNPQAFDRVIGKIRMARNRTLGLRMPAVTIFFSIEKEGTEEEHILLLWIEETDGIESASHYLM